MKRCITIENFLPDPQAERVAALAAPYVAQEHRGLSYPGISEVRDTFSEARLREILKLQGGHFTSFWRRYLPGEKQGTWIHNDCQIGQWSAILFLTAPANTRGGLAFWRHRLYGWERQPQEAEVNARGLVDAPELWDSVHRDGFYERKWEMVHYVGMAFNRLVVFPSGAYHSRYPEVPIGTGPSDCRLVKTFFWHPGTEQEARGAAA